MDEPVVHHCVPCHVRASLTLEQGKDVRKYCHEKSGMGCDLSSGGPHFHVSDKPHTHFSWDDFAYEELVDHD